MTTVNQSQAATTNTAEQRSFSRRVWITVAIAATVFVALFVIWQALEILLALFAGILVAVFLHGASRFIAAHTPIPRKAALFVVLGLIVAALLLLGVLAFPTINQQLDQMSLDLSDAWETLQSQMRHFTIGQIILESMPDSSASSGGSGLTSQLFTRVGNAFSSTFDMATKVVLILFVGIYLAYDPPLYINGLVKLAPQQYRGRIHRFVSETVYTLQRWLAGQIVAMLIIGVVTTVGLMFLGMPLAPLLGLMAGLLEFIPILGSLTAAVVAILLAFTQSPQTALFVGLFYVVIQVLEGNVLTPLIQKKAVRLPPALLLASQVFLGLFGGIIGVMVAAPLTVTIILAVKMLYVEGILDDHSVKYLSESDEEEPQPQEDERQEEKDAHVSITP